jgi:putative SOS response-associated peptidase YedK
LGNEAGSADSWLVIRPKRQRRSRCLQRPPRAPPPDRLFNQEAVAILANPSGYPPETFPDYDSPLILINKDDTQDCIVANFGFAPAEYAPAGMPNPMNARAETVGTNRMFGKYWRACNLCIVPVDAVYEPCYETGHNVRHKIWIKGESEFGIAGIWRTWESPTGGPPRYAFAMLTLNAGG